MPAAGPRWLGCLLMLAVGCSAGQGEGALMGVISVEGCGEAREYDMSPDFFGAEPVEDLLEIRVQRGSGPESEVDGIHMLVRNAEELQQSALGTSLALDNLNGPVGMTLYLNRSCPPRRDRTPVVLPAQGGQVTFDSIYAPEGDSDMVEIAAILDNVQFADPRNAARSAQLSGHFRFLFQRGSPAQRFP